MFDQPTVGEARALIEAQGLRFEPGYDELVGLYDNGELFACGARAGYVLKMLAILPSHQGTDALGELVTHLLRSGLAAGHPTLLVFTRPQHVASFEALNFRLLATHGTAALLEHGPGLEAYAAEHAEQLTPGRNGAVVLNGNPFTLGHLHLIEQAAQAVDRLYVFVLSEDCSAFPFAVRLRLAQEGCAHLAKVTVLESSRYAVSAGTFPAYFLKRLDEVAQAQMQLDLRVFAERIAPLFHLACRFVGQEPLCATTAAYNRAMVEVLGANGLQCVELPRLAVAGAAVSASRVRAAFASGDDLALAALVPGSTLAFLRSTAARPIAERLNPPTRTQIKGA